MAYQRAEYYQAAKTQLEQNIFYHSLALEACLGKIYDYLKAQGSLGENEPIKEDWLLAGLIHDLDYSGEFKAEHPKRTRAVLAKYNLEISELVLNIILAHAPDLTGVQPKSKAEWAIFCADSLTGLIVAVALIYPSKKLAEVKTSSVLKRFLKDLRFAAGTRREEVRQCENPGGLNIPLEKFIEICLEAMKEIAPEIEL